MALHLSNQSADIKSPSVDKDTMMKFKELAPDWWGLNAGSRCLHIMNEIRIPFIVDCLRNLGNLDPKFANTSKPLTNLKIMDVGCGGGFCSEVLSELGATVTAIEPCTALIQVAKEHAKENNTITNEIRYINAAIEQISDQYKNKFDVVVLYDIAHHIDNYDSVIKASLQVLKPGGSFFHGTFNKTPLAWTYGIIFFEYVINKTPKKCFQFDRFISPQQVTNILRKYNCETKTVEGNIFFNEKWIKTKNNSFHYLLHAVKDK